MTLPFAALYEELDAANHSISYCTHLMEVDPSDRTIAEYEKALDYAASIRMEIGRASHANLARLDYLAGPA